MSDRASPTAIVALCISIASACLSLFQWWHAQSEARVVAAIEISRHHSKEVKGGIGVLLAYQHKKTSEDQVLDIVSAAGQYDEIAFLANRGRLDERYLSENLKCGFVFANGAVEHLNSLPEQQGRPLVYPELKKMAVRMDCTPAIKASVDRGRQLPTK